MNIPLDPAVLWNSTFSCMFVGAVKMARFDVYETVGVTEFLVAETNQ
jgi:hypothetical protein